MIVRILGEEQLDVADAEFEGLNVLDEAVKTAFDAGDEVAFAGALVALNAAVRRVGTPLTSEQLRSSDLVLPPTGAKIENVVELIKDDGLIEG